jgi:hypothetical protein
VPWARIVLDKFHAMRMVDDCAHRVRTRTSRNRATNLPNNRSGHQFDRKVRRLRWAFSKRANTLTDDERSKLFAMFELYPETARSSSNAHTGGACSVLSHNVVRCPCVKQLRRC